jgi:hypothetical protein
VATQVKALLLTSGAVGERNVEVGDVVEEVDLVLVQEETGSNGVNGSVTPALVEETAVLVQSLEEVDVGLAAQPLQTADLEVGPLNKGQSINSHQVHGGALTKWHKL